MLYSNIQGFNDDSGLIYKTFNGLAQYKGDRNQYPSYSAPQPKYINERNEKELLETMQDDSTDLVNKNGNKRISDIPNVGLSDGGFKNKGNVENQTDTKSINKLNISAEVKALARRNIKRLPTEKSKPTRGSEEIMSKFKSFLDSLEKNKVNFGNPTKGRSTTVPKKKSTNKRKSKSGKVYKKVNISTNSVDIKAMLELVKDVDKKYTMPNIASIDKYTKLCEDLINFKNIKRPLFKHLLI